MFLQQLALISEVNGITLSQLTRVSAAIQKQVMRDFTSVWSTDATCDAFTTLEDVPIGYWPIIIRDDIGFAGAAGIHLDQDNQPFALVQFTNRWELTVSHEALEMLADPFGNRLIAGDSIKPGQGRVEYLVEVCDPSEDVRFSYTVNGISVSDFYSPRFFDPAKTSGARYSFTGAIRRPREVLKNGYLSWRDPASNHWWQQIYFGARKRFRDLGVLTSSAESLRAQIDRLTVRPERLKGVRGGSLSLLTASAPPAAITKSVNAKAKAWHTQIEALKKKYGK